MKRVTSLLTTSESSLMFPAVLDAHLAVPTLEMSTVTDAAATSLMLRVGSTIEIVKAIAASSELGNDNVMIGLTTFSTQATYHGMFAPCDPNDPSQPNPALVEKLRTFLSGGYTHFDDALDKIIEFYQEAPTDRTNILMFMSDGFPHVPGDGDNEEPTNECHNNQPSAFKFDSELAISDSFDVRRIAIGIGSGSDVSQNPCMGLCMIDNTPDPVTGERGELVTTTDALTEILTRNPVIGTIIDFTLSTELHRVESTRA